MFQSKPLFCNGDTFLNVFLFSHPTFNHVKEFSSVPWYFMPSLVHYKTSQLKPAIHKFFCFFTMIPHELHYLFHYLLHNCLHSTEWNVQTYNIQCSHFDFISGKNSAWQRWFWMAIQISTTSLHLWMCFPTHLLQKEWCRLILITLASYSAITPARFSSIKNRLILSSMSHRIRH